MLIKTISGAKPVIENSSILAADDNPMLLLKIQLILERFAARTDFAENGREALEAVQHQKYDLVMIDLHMPEMDGLTAAPLIRAYTGDSVPVIAMSAHFTENEIRSCKDAGMNGYLLKPVEEESLTELLGNFFSLGQHKTGASSGGDLHPWLNHAYLQDICMDDPVKLNAILEALIRELEENIRYLKVILQNREPDNLKKMMHYMKSSLDCFADETPPVQAWHKLKTIAGTVPPGSDSVWQRTAEWIHALEQALKLSAPKKVK